MEAMKVKLEPWRVVPGKDEIACSDSCLIIENDVPENDENARHIAFAFDDQPDIARLVASAPAYVLAWSMVPKEIQERIFDALHKPDTEWVEQAIRQTES